MATYKGNPIIQLGIFNKTPSPAIPKVWHDYHEGMPLKWLENALEYESPAVIRDHFDTASKTFMLLGISPEHCGFAVAVETEGGISAYWVTVEDYNDITN